MLRLTAALKSRMAKKLQDKTALVTGAGHGIGAAIAKRLAEEGANVLVTDIDEERANTTVNTISEAGNMAAGFVMDVTDREQISAAIANATARWGALNIAVNNAGIMDRMPFLEMDDDFWWHTLRTNLYGAFATSQLSARQMVAQKLGGRIINVASNSGIFGGRGRAAYGASKAGIINLTQSMAIELAEHNILVNAVAPGPTKTREDQPDVPWPSVLSRMPLARFGRPEEIAAVAAFLASDECSFTTGHVYAADGGFTISGIMEG